jgi:Fe-S cluster biogenesis protein NfuA
MATDVDEKDFRRRMHRVEDLLRQVDSFGDPAVRAHVAEIVRTLMDFHGIGLERILGRIIQAGTPGANILDSLAHDDVVGSLLLLYGLHPATLGERIRHALVKVGPQLAAHGGSVAMVSLIDGALRLRLQGSCHGCPSSAVTLKQTIEEAIVAAAPEVTTIEVENDEPLPVAVGSMTSPGRIDLPLVHA